MGACFLQILPYTHGISLYPNQNIEQLQGNFQQVVLGYIVVNILWVYDPPHNQPQYILALVDAFPNQHEHSCMLFLSFLVFIFVTNEPSSHFFFEGLCKHPRIIILLSCLPSSTLVNKFSSICIVSINCVFLSVLPCINDLGPLPLDPATWARNAFIPSTCITNVVVSSHAASNNHDCILCVSVELPLSASFTFEYPHLQKAGKCGMLITVIYIISFLIC